MAVWTSLADALFDTGKPGNGSIFKELRDNITALSEGASGAPKIQTAAYDTGSVDAAALGTDSVTKVKIAANSVGGSEIINSLQSGSYQTIDGAQTWIPPAGIYMVAVDISAVDVEIYVSGLWQGGANTPSTCLIMSDGSNVRFEAQGTTANIYYKKISD